MNLEALTSLSILFANMSNTPSIFPTGFVSPIQLPGAPPPWARYSTFLDSEGGLQFNPPRGSHALKKALEWQFPEEHSHLHRLRKATELYHESIDGLVVSSHGLETTTFASQQRASPALSSHSTPISRCSGTSGPRKRGKRGTSCKKHYDDHAKVEFPPEFHLRAYLADMCAV